MKVQVRTDEGEVVTHDCLNVYIEDDRLVITEEGEVMVTEADVEEMRKAIKIAAFPRTSNADYSEVPEPGSVVKGAGTQAVYNRGAWDAYRVVER